MFRRCPFRALRHSLTAFALCTTQTYKSQGRTLIRLGDTDVDYSEEFKFYITSTLSNPHYAPEVCIKITVVNFTVTFEGLEDQLLAEVASIERPDLEAKKESLVVSIADGRRTIKKLEDEILRMLAESSGNILDDELLINTLDSSKKTSAKTEASVKGAEETMQEIAIARENYRPVATLGSILYFVVSDFAVRCLRCKSMGQPWHTQICSILL